jgi:PPOX class probable F420-dependent enzyme
MKLTAVVDDLRTLLEAPSPAVLTLYRENGEALVSPAWFRVHGDEIQVVVALADAKLAHLRRDPRCVMLVFETTPPFRGVRVRGRATLTPDEGARVRLAIASRYLGAEAGRRYADADRRPPGVVVSLPLRDARAWDLRASLA